MTEGQGGITGLEAELSRLFEEQTSEWPLLARGLVGLRAARTRTLRLGTASLALRHIPHRRQSTTARVDAASIAARPCFLCAENRPPEQRGVAFGDEWTLLCNPFPILERHITIVERGHVPQRIAGRIRSLLGFARALPGSFVIYNGPECGASAPDHLHFQAASRALFPIEAAVGGRQGLLEHPSRPLLLQDADDEALVARLERLLAAVPAPSVEPLVNLAAFASDGRLAVLVFIRRRHRPAAFARGELLLSPAAVDLCGVPVLPRAEDYERLSAEDLRLVFDEVMAERADLEALAARAGLTP